MAVESYSLETYFNLCKLVDHRLNIYLNDGDTIRETVSTEELLAFIAEQPPGNTYLSREEVSVLISVGALSPNTKRPTDKQRRDIKGVNYQAIAQYLREHQSKLPSINTEDEEANPIAAYWEGIDPKFKIQAIEVFGLKCSKAVDPKESGVRIFAMLQGGKLLYDKYYNNIVVNTDGATPVSTADRLEAYIQGAQIDYTDLYALFPYEVCTDEEGTKYRHGIYLQASMGGEKVLESVGLLLTSNIREDIRQALGAGFLKLAKMYNSTTRRRKYSAILLLEQLVKAPEVYVTILHPQISKICQYMLEDPDIGPEVLARFKKRIRE